MKLLGLILLSLALILEATLTTIPLVFLVLVVLAIIFKENWIFLFAFIFGLFLDLVSFRTLGISSSFFVIVLFLVLLYQRRFEIATNYFVLTASFFGSLGCLALFSRTNDIIIESITGAIIGLLIFLFLKRVEKSKFSIFNS